MAASAKGGIIDTHLHIWDRSRFRYPWLTPGSPLDRDIWLEDVRADMQAHQVRGGLLVEAANTPEEIDWLLTVAEGDDLNWGVIGWIDLEAEDAREMIRRYAQSRRFKGIRMNWLETREALPQLHTGLAEIADYGLVVDVLIHPDQLAAAANFMCRYSEVTFVLNHFGGWPLTPTGVDRWHEAIQPLTELPNVILKVSSYASVDCECLRTYLHAADNLFGVHRLLFGSNYPFCPDGYSAALSLLKEAVSDQSEHWQTDLFQTTASSVYHLP